MRRIAQRMLCIEQNIELQIRRVVAVAIQLGVDRRFE
jgi:hypothetical protein